MKNLLKGLEIDLEKDGIITTMAKASLGSTIKTASVAGVIGLTFLAIGKISDKAEQKRAEMQKIVEILEEDED